MGSEGKFRKIPAKKDGNGTDQRKEQKKEKRKERTKEKTATCWMERGEKRGKTKTDQPQKKRK